MNKIKQDPWILKFELEALPILKAEYKPEKIILFGSRINGYPREESDIDVIIISKKFSGLRFIDRMPMLLRKLRFPKHIDFFCYSPEEMERMKNISSVVMDALENGIEV